MGGVHHWYRYSIHVADKDREEQQEAEASFPKNVDGLDNVFHCGFHSELSFGCASYLVTRPEGNILVDVPRFVPKLLKRIQVCSLLLNLTLAVSGAKRPARYPVFFYILI